MKLETYIPYSIRNNITDHDLAGLLDYLEREMGWEIYFEELLLGKIVILSQDLRENDVNVTRIEILDGSVIIKANRCIVLGTNRRLFFRTYKSILPAIRDLYRKK